MEKKMKYRILSSALTISVAFLSLSAQATTFSYDYTYDGSTLTTNQTSEGSPLAVGDVVNLTLHTQGSDYWSATAGQDLWAPISMQEAADRTGNATWSFLMNGFVLDSGSYFGQTSSAAHIINFTDPSIDVNFNEFKSSFTLTAYSLLDAGVTTNTLGPIFTMAAGSPEAFYIDTPTYVASVPEPETYAMMLAGLGLMGAIARRRKGKQG
jgi:hypothetical protein